MQVLAPGSVQIAPSFQVDASLVLGTQLLLNLEEFPELEWLSSYLSTLHTLRQERDRLTQSIQAIAEEGDVYRDCWIEPYTKTKNGKSYSYHQLRWLTGERKSSDQPKIKTKHLSKRSVGQVQAAIDRGKQLDRLERERIAVEEAIIRLRQLVRGTGRQLQRLSSQNSTKRWEREP